MTSDPTTHKTEGDDRELIQLRGGRLCQDADCVGEERSGNKHADSHQAYQRCNDPAQPGCQGCRLICVRHMDALASGNWHIKSLTCFGPASLFLVDTALHEAGMEAVIENDTRSFSTETCHLLLSSCSGSRPQQTQALQMLTCLSSVGLSCT